MLPFEKREGYNLGTHFTQWSPFIEGSKSQSFLNSAASIDFALTVWLQWEVPGETIFRSYDLSSVGPSHYGGHYPFAPPSHMSALWLNCFPALEILLQTAFWREVVAAILLAGEHRIQN